MGRTKRERHELPAPIEALKKHMPDGITAEAIAWLDKTLRKRALGAYSTSEVNNYMSNHW